MTNQVETKRNKKMFKLSAKVILRSLGRKLPWGAKRALLDGMVGGLNRFEIFQEMGHALGVESVSVRGKNGLAWGSLNDRWLLGAYALRREWSSEMIELFQHFFSANDGGTYLDIGANIGLTLFPIAQNPRVQCYGFEPEPRNFAYLNLGLGENCTSKNVVVNQLALFDRKGKIKFELSPSNLGDHRVRIAETDGLVGEASRETIFVDADRLDDIVDINRLKRPIAVKIDTQGAEPNVFIGGATTMATVDLVMLEFCPHLMRRIGGDVEVEFQILAAHFREGQIASGDTEGAVVNWRPISAVVEELRCYWEDPAIGMKYFDVIVRK
jgi:FkbM family methyltransferase